MTIRGNKMNEKVSVAQMKSRLSEFIAKVAYSNKRIIITKRSKPVAALIDIDTFEKIEGMDEAKGLVSVIGRWEGFEEIASDIHRIYNSRKEDESRDVSI